MSASSTSATATIRPLSGTRPRSRSRADYARLQAANVGEWLGAPVVLGWPRFCVEADAIAQT